ncbi:unnamed protein product [Absidia cylindrospora]
MMLKSKASRNEDRLYAILPQSEYRCILSDKNKVSEWNITTLTDVKLKLYEFMNTKDKLNLLFWSSHSKSSNQGMVLPTFATSTLSSDAPNDYLACDSCNFDLNDPSTIMLYHYQIDSKDSADEDEDALCDLYCLRLKPMEYYVYAPHDCEMTDEERDYSGDCHDIIEYDAPSLCINHWNRLQMDDINPNNNTFATTTGLDIVAIEARNTNRGEDGVCMGDCIFLVGSFHENKWSLQWTNDEFNLIKKKYWKQCYNSENGSFDIY